VVKVNFVLFFHILKKN